MDSFGRTGFPHRALHNKAEYYSALLEVPVKATIRNKRKRAPISSFLQDNACGRSHHGHHPETEMERSTTSSIWSRPCSLRLSSLRPPKGAYGWEKVSQKWGSDTGCSGVATLATKRLLPEQHPQASGPLAQVYRIPGRLCWKVTISVSENKSMFLFYLQIIIHICPPLVLRFLQ